ncbi:MAG: hypothetical protein AB1714_19995 [Acidobacteriota bacterium]
MDRQTDTNSGHPRIDSAFQINRYMPWLVLAGAAAIGLAFFAYYYQHDLTMVHYDAKARLLVARRIFDNATPGIQQMGLYWLPLPTLINLPLVTSDVLYRTGILSSLLSVAFFAGAAFFLYRLMFILRSDAFIAAAAAAIFVTTPAVLYVQATPLTESLYFFLFLGGSYFFARFTLTEDRRDLAGASAAIALATLVRYDGWSLWAGMNVMFVLYLLQCRQPWSVKRKYLVVFLLISSLGIISFQSYAFYVTGTPFPQQKDARPLDPYSSGDLFKSFRIYVQCAGDLSGRLVYWAAALGIAIFFTLKRFKPPYLAAYALLHPIPLFVFAYFNGHPYRVRYSVVMVPAIAAFATVWWPARPRHWAKALLVALLVANAVYASPKRQRLLKEATYHVPEINEREQAIEFMNRHYDGRPVLISMGWLAPFLHDWGIPLRYTVHEGVYATWDRALSRPADVVDWIVVEDKDALDQVRVENPNFLRGFKPALRLSNLAIYQKDPHAALGAPLNP